jgi:F-type H+-transporting ATPase subunit a
LSVYSHFCKLIENIRIVKDYIRRVLFVVLLAFATSVSTFASSSENEDEKFDPVGLIMHHVLDSHSWTIFKNDNIDITVPLPIILIHNGKITSFLSSEFGHGENVVSRNGSSFRLFHEKIYLTNASGDLALDAEGHPTNPKPFDLSITKTVVALWVSIGVLMLLFLTISRRYRKVMVKPRGAQSLLEPIILFVRDNIAMDMIGKHKGPRFVPYLLTLFFFIWINNILGLVPFFPGGANVTGNITITALLAVVTLLITVFSGNKGYWMHMIAPPGVPKWVLPLLAPVELIGIITKPFALMMRLFANITAGHIIILSLLSMIFVVQSLSFAPVSIFLVVFMMLLELIVGFLQAFIFTMLTALFIGMAVQEEAH